jgi:hypothetical protein
MRFETHSRPWLTHEFNASAFERPPNLLNRFEMRPDRSLQSFKPPDSRDRNTGVQCELMLLPPDQRSRRFYLACDYEHLIYSPVRSTSASGVLW